MQLKRMNLRLQNTAAMAKSGPKKCSLRLNLKFHKIKAVDNINAIYEIIEMKNLNYAGMLKLEIILVQGVMWLMT